MAVSVDIFHHTFGANSRDNPELSDSTTSFLAVFAFRKQRKPMILKSQDIHVLLKAVAPGASRRTFARF
jgi:hypothetical protein